MSGSHKSGCLDCHPKKNKGKDDNTITSTHISSINSTKAYIQPYLNKSEHMDKKST